MGWWKKIRKISLDDLVGRDSEIRKGLRSIDKEVLQPLWNKVIPIVVTWVVKEIIVIILEELGIPIPDIPFPTIPYENSRAIPLHLKIVMQEMQSEDVEFIPKVDLTAVRFVEGVNPMQDGHALAVCDEIYFPEKLQLDRENLNKDHLRALLHQLEYVNRYNRMDSSQARTDFLNRNLASPDGGPPGTDIKKALQVLHKTEEGREWEDAATKIADVYLDTVLKELDDLALGRPTKLERDLGSRLYLDNENRTMYEGDYMSSPNGQYIFVCQSDGNNVLIAPGNVPIWSTQTNGMGKPPYRIVMQHDRNVVQYDRDSHPMWRTDTGLPEDVEGCFLQIQDDRNLVLYHPVNGQNIAIWTSHTNI